ncbi:MAG: RidA family protein [candidate division Zixibacteria bacterium]|nr:RidA family protein [candidate division Zixibacteria bacterium]
MKAINSPNLPSPLGHYVHAMKAGNMIFLSGQLGVGPDDNPDREVEDQVIKSLTAHETILRDIGLDRKSIAKTTIYISDIDLWPRVNACYADFFGDHKPARCVVPCPDLHYGSKIEIEAIAYVESDS